MHQKYTIAFSSNTNLVFMVVLKFAGFSVSFSSIYKIIFHNFGARILILYLLFVSLKEGTIYFERNWLGNDAKALRT